MAFMDLFTGHKGRKLGGGGYDLTKKQYRRSDLAPAYATAGLMESQDFQQWANPESIARSAGAESIYGGTQTAQRMAGEQASRMGLGRGAATQMQSDIRRQAMNSISEAMLSSRMLGMDRRLEGSSMLLDAIMGGQAQSNLRSLRHRSARPTGMGQRAFAGALGSEFGGAMGQMAGQLPNALLGLFSGGGGGQAAGGARG